MPILGGMALNAIGSVVVCEPVSLGSWCMGAILGVVVAHRLVDVYHLTRCVAESSGTGLDRSWFTLTDE